MSEAVSSLFLNTALGLTIVFQPVLVFYVVYSFGSSHPGTWVTTLFEDRVASTVNKHSIIICKRGSASEERIVRDKNSSGGGDESCE